MLATVESADPEKNIYGFTMGRIGVLVGFVFAFSFILDEIISTLIDREFAFLVVSILVILLIPIILFFLKNVEGYEEEVKDSASGIIRAFLTYFRGGINYLFSSKTSFLILTGLAIIDAVTLTWFSLNLFPLYFGYTGSDAGVGFLRSFLLIVGGIIRIYSAKWCKLVSSDKMAILFFIQFVGLFVGVMTSINVIPLIGELNLIGIISLLLLLVSINPTVGAIAFILRQRVLLESTPSEYRNSIYSLINSIATLILLPLMIHVGGAIEQGSLTDGLLNITGITLISTLFLFIPNIYFLDPPIWGNLCFNCML